MRVAFFSTHSYDKESFDEQNKGFGFGITYFEVPLSEKTVDLAKDHDVVCAFVTDHVGVKVLEKINSFGINLVALRSAGFNHVDLEAANKFGIKVVRVPAYSPNSVAEHTIGLILALNRKICKAYNRTREMNFSINGLMGFDLNGKTVGVIGLGEIGSIVARSLDCFGCNVLVYDPYVKESSSYFSLVTLDELLKSADIITLHCPLNPETHHIVDQKAVSEMKKGVMLINTSRGAVVDTNALIQGLKKGHIGYLGLDVYEEEEHVFFEDLSDKIIQDDTLARLLTFPNVIITSHQAFFTKEAVENIAKTTLQNIDDFAQGKELENIIG